MTEIDLTNYPSTWDGYIGQDIAKRQLKLAIASARARGDALDHVFLTAQAGVGKTSLALLIAAEMTKGRGHQYKFATGPMSWVQFVMLTQDMVDGDVLIIDEFHKLMEGGKRNAEWLLSYLQDGVIVTSRGITPQPKVTVIATTTDPERVPDTILGRFPIRPAMRPYSDDEAAKIAQVMARGMLGDLPQPTLANCRQLAGAANRNPRAIRRLLTTLRDLVVTGELEAAGGRGFDMAPVLDMHDVTEDGLDRVARTYLTTLIEEFAGKAGARAIQGRLGVPVDETERLLLDRGLITRTSSGREITPAGVRRVYQLGVAA